MPGTAEGAKRARERQAALRQQRRQQAVVVAEQSDQALMGELIQADAAVMPDARRSGTVSPAVQQLGDDALASAKLLGAIVRGKVKAPAQVRANCAIRVLELNGIGERKAHGAGTVGEMMPAQLAAFLTRATGAARLNQAAASAETVEPIEGEASKA